MFRNVYIDNEKYLLGRSSHLFISVSERITTQSEELKEDENTIYIS